MRKPEELKSFLGRDQLRLYKLIWERFVASQMASAIMDTVTARLINNNVQFRASGSVVKFPGFMKVYVESKDDGAEEKDKMLPPLEVGETVFSKDLEPKQHFTQPPPRYTEARLVRTLEELGIGRPSTYVPTLETIQKRGYVGLDNKRFVPTELGEIVIELILEFFPEIINIEFTANMEQSLDEVEEGNANWVKIVDDFYVGFEPRLEKRKKKCVKWKLKMNQLGKIVNYVITQWSLKWVNTGNLWLARISQIVVIQSRL